MNQPTRASNRFRGTASSKRTQNLTAAITLATILAVAVAGVLAGATTLMFFAVGAGAGYSLSGSV